MKKRLLSLTIFTALFIGACSDEAKNPNSTEEQSEVAAENESNTDTNNKQEEQKPTQTVASLDGVVKHFENKGFSIGEKTSKAYSFINADDGFGLEVNGTEVEFYQYEPGSEALKEIQTTGQYDMDGIVIEALSNGNIVMISHQFHTEKDKIIETFNSYK